MKIMLMGSPIEVTFPETVLLEDDDQSTADGAYTPNTNSIEISSKLCQAQQMSTLCHELCHAWLDRSLFTNIIDKANVEEMIVESFQLYLAPLIWDLAKSSKVTNIRDTEWVSSKPKAKVASKKKKAKG